MSAVVKPSLPTIAFGLLSVAVLVGGCAGSVDDQDVTGSGTLAVTTQPDEQGADSATNPGQSSLGMTGIEAVDEVYRGEDDEPTIDLPEPTPYYETSPVGAELPDGQTCAEQVRDNRWLEHRPENGDANNTVFEVGVDLPAIDIDGAEQGDWNDLLAPRITGDFTGTTEQVLRWGACKWGFDEDVTKARAVTESSWRMSTAGDVTESVDDCGSIGLEAPCPLSYGLLQVKGSVHVGTYPWSTQSSALGVDYAMAWLRACYEGAFVWLVDDGYEAGDEWGCVGAWFSGEWYDAGARRYVEEVRGHLEQRTWDSYLR
jgi:hypothetical protein